MDNIFDNLEKTKTEPLWDTRRPRQYLIVTNNTNRKDEKYGRTLFLTWSDDTDQGQSLESLLEPGKHDQKRSRRTHDANFVVKVHREKNGEWEYIGEFNEHVSSIEGRMSDTERCSLFISPVDENHVCLYKSGEDDDASKVIKLFELEDW
ncbi:hypothetical protein [Bacillus sp. ISL-45]|uniref:hypothetical protein n=1 Tax=Bacillus sp. ISL-45 TaxID=2819128 RepID=UPI001BE62F5D|nr:hypothetical protein [Bacillus sp. ISL-45]MBT2663087.1 hypothetical protein [Bacillus sp. ISL-45]